MAKVIKIKIDAGHGAHDPGAVANGLKEKDLTLSISKRVKAILDDYEGVQVSLTRSTDVFLELSKRADLANKDDVDLLMSIHINAGGGTGFETFIFNNNPKASTVAAQNVIHAAIMKEIGGVDRGKKRKNLAVLRESNMTAILTEVAFIDHKSDAVKLKDTSFLEKAAQGHAKGIINLFGLKKKAAATKPSPAVEERHIYVVRAGDTMTKIAEAYGTTVEALAKTNRIKEPHNLAVGYRMVVPEPKTYTVVKGDTLSKIAAAHNTTVDNLVKINSLKNKNEIVIGQVLKLN